MFARGKKIISTLLALALLLAPVEFVFAQGTLMSSATGNPMSARMAMSHHADAGQQHTQTNDHDDGCSQRGFCKYCVYCSPALSGTTPLQLDKPTVAVFTPPIITDYSVDLPVDIRPPRIL